MGKAAWPGAGGVRRPVCWGRFGQTRLPAVAGWETEGTSPHACGKPLGASEESQATGVAALGGGGAGVPP